MDELEMKLHALDFMLDDLRAEQITREILYEAAQAGISPEEVLEAMDSDDILEAEAIEIDPAARLADKAKHLLGYPVTRQDVLNAADEVVAVAEANNTTPEAVIKEVAKSRPKTTCKIKVFND